MAIDGDTLQILPADEGCRVRLWGVDAAEVSEDAGAAARDALATMLVGATLDCTDVRGRSYGRHVALCVATGRGDIAADLVRRGFAIDWPLYSGGHYAPAEAEARREGRGMWGD